MNVYESCRTRSLGLSPPPHRSFLSPRFPTPSLSLCLSLLLLLPHNTSLHTARVLLEFIVACAFARIRCTGYREYVCVCVFCVCVPSRVSNLELTVRRKCTHTSDRIINRHGRLYNLIRAVGFAEKRFENSRRAVSTG